VLEAQLLGVVLERHRLDRLRVRDAGNREQGHEQHAQERAHHGASFSIAAIAGFSSFAITSGVSGPMCL